MRLIDADEFAIEEPKLWDWSSVDGISSTAVLRQCIWDVQCAPTVEAIPIDKPFLKMRYGDYVVYNKKWLVDHLQTEWSILQGKEYQPSIPVEWIKKQKVDFQNEDYPFNYCRGFQDGYNDCIDYLIDEWKEENEQTN